MRSSPNDLRHISAGQFMSAHFSSSTALKYSASAKIFEMSYERCAKEKVLPTNFKGAVCQKLDCTASVRVFFASTALSTPTSAPSRFPV